MEQVVLSSLLLKAIKLKNNIFIFFLFIHKPIHSLFIMKNSQAHKTKSHKTKPANKQKTTTNKQTQSF